jgi:predicted FMN-binding regulatory protein PaiB
MYDLPYFKENDKELVLAFMRQHPFIFLTGVEQTCSDPGTCIS